MDSHFPRSFASLAADYRSHLGRQAGLCARLERIADSLPDQCDVQECLFLAQSLSPVVKGAHEFEEKEVFPVLRDSSLAEMPSLSVTLERLGLEHMGDEVFADELTSALRDFAARRNTFGPETLSWMLRAFFEAMRRHLAFEQEYVLPLLDRKSTQ